MLNLWFQVYKIKIINKEKKNNNKINRNFNMLSQKKLKLQNKQNKTLIEF